MLPLLCCCSRTPIDYVDPLIGTDAHGHTFPAAIAPFGMLQVGPDTRLEGWDGCSAYHYTDDTIYGFSHTHLSGTGVSDYGDLLLMPFTDEVRLSNKEYASPFSHKHEKASPSYYSVILDKTQVKVELTAGPRVAYHNYYYPQRDKKGFLIDLTHRDVTLDASIACEGNRITGHRISAAWNPEQHFYFAMEIDNMVDSIVLYQDDKPVRDAHTLQGKNIKAAVYLNEAEDIAAIRVAISATDIQGALANLQSEAPKSFKQARLDNEALWEKELDKITVEGGSKTNKTAFYTALYHCMTAPYLYSDADGRYRGMNLNRGRKVDTICSTEGKFDRYTVFSLWDTYRALHPLLTLIDRERTLDFMYTFLEVYRQSGELPMWELASHETHCMIGYHAAPVVLEAYRTGLLDSLAEVDRMTLLQALIETSNRDEGQRYYNDYGYLSSDIDNESVSKTLEYAYDDWCIAMLAKGYLDEMGGMTAVKFEEATQNMDPVKFQRKYVTGIYENTLYPAHNLLRKRAIDGMVRSATATPDDKAMTLRCVYAWYMKRCQSWKNILDADGFAHARRNGGFVTPFSPAEVNNHFTEANSWQYSTYVPHDVQGWVTALGGEQKAINMLDSLFHTTAQLEGRDQSDITGLIGQYAHGNEPSHHAAYLYAYLGQQWKTAELVRRICQEFYTDRPDGLIGNEDCGQMSAWLVMSALGFYEVCPGSGEYIIGSPLFDRAVMKLENGKEIVITCANQSEQNCYVQSLKVDGKEHSSCVLTYEELCNGATLEFTLGSKPSETFGCSENDRAHSSIPQETVVTPKPIFNDWKQRFDGEKKVTISLPAYIAEGSEIRYVYYPVVDEDETVYTGPITVSNNDNRIKAWAYHPVTGWSGMEEQILSKFNADKRLRYITRPDPQYIDSGEEGLIDNILGKENYRVGGWQGWQEDMVVEIDLLESKSVNNVTVRCLSSTKSWIFLPDQIIVEVSNDGKSYRPWGESKKGLADAVENDEQRGFDYREGSRIYPYEIKGTAPARYLRITAKNYGALPWWHISAGQQAWLFVDEITIH